MFEELKEKCKPSLFQEDDTLFKSANLLYSKILSSQQHDDQSLRPLRDRAISELHIHISTKRKYDYLKRYFDVVQYENIIPYDQERVAMAYEYVKRLESDKQDIQKLEILEADASEFIARREKEVSPHTPSSTHGSAPAPDSMIGLWIFFSIIIVICLFCVFLAFLQ